MVFNRPGVARDVLQTPVSLINSFIEVVKLVCGEAVINGATLSSHIVFTWFPSFTWYEDDIFQVISNLHVQR